MIGHEPKQTKSAAPKATGRPVAAAQAPADARTASAAAPAFAFGAHDGGRGERCTCGGRGGPCKACRERLLQRKRESEGPFDPGSGEAVDRALAQPGFALDAETADWFGAGFNRDFRDVRVRIDDPSTRALRALAFTVGDDIVFRPGYFAPESPAGRGLLAHELVHVAQQGQGGDANSSAVHEAEADRAGA